MCQSLQEILEDARKSEPVDPADLQRGEKVLVELIYCEQHGTQISFWNDGTNRLVVIDLPVIIRRA